MDKLVQELLERYEKGLGSDDKTRPIYMGYAQDFLLYSDGSFDRDVILKYLDKLRRRKRSDGTINFIFRVIRTVYNRNSSMLTRDGIEWPFRRGETPQIRESSIIAPALDPDVIIEMIAAVMAAGQPEERAFLALSTTYALRRQEMAELTPEDVRIKDRTIHITTLKHGRERTHAIPDEIIPVLEEWDFSTPISLIKLLTVWHDIEARIDFPHINQVGWHSIRRTVNTLLRDSLPVNVVQGFLRWKQRTSSDMSFRYSAQTFVGRDTTSTRVVGEAKDVDSKVFAVHPFLKYWR